MFSCEICKIFKDSFFFTEQPRWLLPWGLSSKKVLSEMSRKDHLQAFAFGFSKILPNIYSVDLNVCSWWHILWILFDNLRGIDHAVIKTIYFAVTRMYSVALFIFLTLWNLYRSKFLICFWFLSSLRKCSRW